ncbi:hypothetical protein DSUL_100092 [Desulfovibrionales bacterium]
MRILDLSQAAATALGIDCKVPAVRIEALSEISSVVKNDFEGAFCIQVGVFKDTANAKAAYDALLKKHLPSRMIQITTKKTLFKIQAGNYLSLSKTKEVLAWIIIIDHPGSFIAAECGQP